MATYSKTGCKRECLAFAALLVGAGQGRGKLEVFVGLAFNSVSYSVCVINTGCTLGRRI